MAQKQDPSKPEEQDSEAVALSRDDVQTMINGALGTHAKRIEKSLGEMLTKALEPLRAQPPTTEEEPKTGASDKVNAAESKAQKEIAELRKRLDDAEKARSAEAEARRRDLTQGQLRQFLEEKGIRKEALSILVTAMSADGTLRYDDDGKPVLVVKRSRSKNAPAEEQLFDDLKQGVEDWSKAPEAAVFLAPPPGVRSSSNQPQSGPFNPNGRTAKRSPLDDFLSSAVNELAQKVEP